MNDTTKNEHLEQSSGMNGHNDEKPCYPDLSGAGIDKEENVESAEAVDDKRKTLLEHDSKGFRIWELPSLDQMQIWDADRKRLALIALQKVIDDYRHCNDEYNQEKASRKKAQQLLEDVVKDFDTIRASIIHKEAKVRKLETQLEESKQNDDATIREHRTKPADAYEDGDDIDRPMVLPSTRSHRSIRFPDPPVLTDGIDPSYDEWTLKMQNKLEANLDHFPTLRLQIGYIQNRLAGEASRHVYPRLREGSRQQIKHPLEIFRVLEQIFADPNRRKTARREFKQLYQKNDSFAVFWAKFQRLIVDLTMDEETLIDELRDRVNISLKQALVRDIEPTSLHDLAQRCLQYEQNRSALDVWDKKPQSWTRNVTNARPPLAIASRQETKPSTERAPRLYRPPNADPAMEKLMKEEKCFHCSKEGHLARDCPDKTSQRRATIRSMAEQAQKEEEEDSEDSGKD